MGRRGKSDKKKVTDWCCWTRKKWIRDTKKKLGFLLLLGSQLCQHSPGPIRRRPNEIETLSQPPRWLLRPDESSRCNWNDHPEPTPMPPTVATALVFPTRLDPRINSPSLRMGHVEKEREREARARARSPSSVSGLGKLDRFPKRRLVVVLPHTRTHQSRLPSIDL